MKNTHSLLLAVLLLAALLIGCGSTQAEETVWQETPTVPQKNESLTVFCIGGRRDSDMIQLALNRYQELHPEISVELIKPEPNSTDDGAEEELYKQVAAQIMAGEGPDVFIIDDTVMDVEKLVRQGVFADMEPFFQADDFDWSPYHETVMDGGVWNGKRFVIPLSYNFPLLFTTRTALEETGFDVDACKDYMGFLEETTRYMEDSTQTRQLFRNAMFVTDITGFSGLSIADYDTRAIDLSSPKLKSAFQWYRTVYEKHPDFFAITSGLDGAAAVRDGEALWTISVFGAIDGFYNDFAAFKTVGEPVMMPVRDVNGGIQAKIQYPVAVRANSENLQNAYDYIKILLSSEIQNELQNGRYLSVLNSANEYFYQEFTQGHMWHIAAGASGFFSTDSLRGTDYPTPEEYHQFVNLTQEITGTYYSSRLGLGGAMYPYIFENADFEETLKAAQRQLELYISE